jgi:hypothetical protein
MSFFLFDPIIPVDPCEASLAISGGIFYEEATSFYILNSPSFLISSSSKFI